jgi:hypothetical protein
MPNCFGYDDPEPQLVNFNEFCWPLRKFERRLDRSLREARLNCAMALELRDTLQEMANRLEQWISDNGAQGPPRNF